jgi:hypothetical protein
LCGERGGPCREQQAHDGGYPDGHVAQWHPGAAEARPATPTRRR